MPVFDENFSDPVQMPMCVETINLDDEDANYSIGQLLTHLRPSIGKSEFDKVERLLRRREEGLKEEYWKEMEAEVEKVKRAAEIRETEMRREFLDEMEQMRKGLKDVEDLYDDLVKWKLIAMERFEKVETDNCELKEDVRMLREMNEELKKQVDAQKVRVLELETDVEIEESLRARDEENIESFQIRFKELESRISLLDKQNHKLMRMSTGNAPDLPESADGFHQGATQTRSLMRVQKRKSLESAVFQTVKQNEFLSCKVSDIEPYDNHKKVKLIEYKSSAEAQTVYNIDADSVEEDFNLETLSKRNTDWQLMNSIYDSDTAMLPKIIRTRGRGRYAGIITRTSPCSLRRVITFLNDDQRLAVASMGLEGILNLELTKIPAKLGYWVVNAFDHQICKLITANAKLTVSEKDVHNILGLPKGGKIIDMKSRSSNKSNLLCQWRRCFGSDSCEIKCSDIVDKIVHTQKADMWFKLHFLVLFWSTMVESTKNQYCNQRIINCIESVEEICGLNWCEYIIQSLIKSKKTWLKDRKSNYTGPLTFLAVFYVDKVEDRLCKYERQWPGIKGIKDEYMSKRQQSEIKQGGFGQGRKLKRKEHQ